MMRRLCQRTGPAVFTVASQLRRHTEAQTVRAPHQYEQFIRAENEGFVSELLAQFKADRGSVDSDWWPVLEAIESGGALPDVPLVKGFSRPKGGSPVNEADERRIDALKFAWMVRSFEQKGHLVAELDPLGLYDADLSPVVPPELQPSFFGFSDAEMDKRFRIARDSTVIGGFTDGQNAVSLREVVDELKAIYCGHIGYEFSHLRSVEEQAWLREKAISAPALRMTQDEIMESLVRSEGFEKLLFAKFQTMKRFGSEGGEAVIPMLEVLIDVLAESGFKNAMVSMAHRGRLNILHNVLGKSLELILNEFKGLTTPDNRNNLGDVKYHLGHNATIQTRSGHSLGVRMAANPSHLECVAPVSQGVVRAMQDTSGTQDTAHIVLHGDAAFSGQGVSFETVAMADLEKFGIGGTIHIITNNQVGFTTNPAQSRSAAYCSDLAKLNNCPVFHVNADKPEAVIRVAQIAAEYRATFNRDVIIDFVCYRRNGHNETDQPRFTQPLMYREIDRHEGVGTLYAKHLMNNQKLTEDQYQQARKDSDAKYRAVFNTWETKQGTEYVPKKWHDPVLPEYPATDKLRALQQTGVDVEKLKKLGTHLATYPDAFKPHPLIVPIIKKRLQSFESGTEIEWSAGEQLALAALIAEGYGVRITGQDVERGTFSQRHYVLHDVEKGDRYNSLANVPGAKPDLPVLIGNSLLSEFAVAGFEMGYSSERRDDLVMWEAQFGDFANGAQVIWDNFLSGCEIKWGDISNLVVSLPHGYDGQGPEHSSARLERFLQLEGSDDVVPVNFEVEGTTPYHANEARISAGNWQVCFTTTSANYFHMLRRQLHRDFRKPLIHFFSKSNLRSAEAKCDIDAFGPGTQFQAVIDQDHIKKARKLVFCSGQVYNALVRQQEKDKVSDIALVRIEQIAPFPWEYVAQVVDKYRKANPNVEIVWAQDEPRNMGAYAYVRPRLRNLLVQRGVPLKQASSIQYVGREPNGSPATGYEFIHKAEEKAILDGVFKK
jgi:2-oxoglutarate dehydrogenase E1 component